MWKMRAIMGVAGSKAMGELLPEILPEVGSWVFFFHVEGLSFEFIFNLI